VIARRCFILAVAILPSLALTTTTSHAQQTSAPDAGQLYAQMTLAMQRAGSVHIQVHAAVLPLGPQQTVREISAGSIDISSKQQLLHAVYTTTYSNVQSHAVVLRDRMTIVAVDGRSAQRESGAQWWCQSVSSQDQSQVYALTALIFRSVTPHFIGGVTSGTALGVPVWRVRIDLGNGTDVLNIAQNNDQLVRVKSVGGVKSAANGVIETFSDFSRYGESVSAQLPAVCR
jgi:hypothetical protein